MFIGTLVCIRTNSKCTKSLCKKIKTTHIQKTDKDEQTEIINELTSNLEKYVTENEELQEQISKLNEAQEQSKIASELLLQSGNEETNKIISERDQLSKLNDEKDITIQQVNDDLEKLRTECRI